MGKAGKAASQPLLEPATYGEHDVERLKAERVTISNRLSGLRTQLKRAGDDAGKKSKVEKRIRDLEGRRAKVAKAIAGKADTVDGALEAQAQASKTAAAEDVPTVADERQRARQRQEAKAGKS